MSKEEILNLLDELVIRLEGPAAQVYELALRANIHVAIVTIVGGILLTIATLVCGITARKLWTQHSQKNSKGYINYWDGPLTASVWGTGLFALATVPMLVIGILSLLNVEWYTLRQLVPGL